MNHQIIFLAAFLILCGCKQNTTGKSELPKIESQTDLVSEEKKVKTKIMTEDSKIERWFEPTELDTILSFGNSFSITLKNADSTQITEYFLEEQVLDSLTKIHNNSHWKALEIENYLLTTNRGIFSNQIIKQ